MTILRLLLVCFCGAIPITIAAPATTLIKIPSNFLLHNYINASSDSLVSSQHISPILSNSTSDDRFLPSDPCIRETSAGGEVVLSNYRSASRFDPSGWEADIEGVLAQAQAEADGHSTSSEVLPQRLVYVEEHAFFYVKSLMLGVTWAIWLAALEQITLFHREWKDYTFSFQIVQRSRMEANVKLLVADGQLRVL